MGASRKRSEAPGAGRRARPTSRASAAARRVRVPKAAELIADAVRAQIARGELRPGSPLPNETELLAHFQVARPTVREALRILEAERLVEIVRGARGGARVREPDIRAASAHCALLLQLQGATIADVYEVRLMLEPAAARLAAERAPRRRRPRARGRHRRGGAHRRSGGVARDAGDAVPGDARRRLRATPRW